VDAVADEVRFTRLVMMTSRFGRIQHSRRRQLRSLKMARVKPRVMSNQIEAAHSSMLGWHGALLLSALELKQEPRSS